MLGLCIGAKIDFAGQPEMSVVKYALWGRQGEEENALVTAQDIRYRPLKITCHDPWGVEINLHHIDHADDDLKLFIQLAKCFQFPVT